MAKNKDIVLFESQFSMISADNSSVLEAMKNNLKTEEITRRDMFTLIPNPSGGDEEWTIETPIGKQTFESFDAIILSIGSERAFYEGEYEEGNTEPPQCSSTDGVIGQGTPGGRCAACENSKFGPDGEIPICSQKKPLYLLIPEVNPVMPVILNVTGPSFKTLKTFNVGLMQYGVNTFDIMVKLSLRKGKTKNNKPASILQFKTITNLKMTDPDGYEKLVAYRNNLLEFIDPSYQKIKKIAEEAQAA